MLENDELLAELRQLLEKLLHSKSIRDDSLLELDRLEKRRIELEIIKLELQIKALK